MKLTTALVMATLLSVPLARAGAQQPAQNPAPAQAAASTQTTAPAPAAETHDVDWAPRQYVELWNTGVPAPAAISAVFNASAVMHARGQRLMLRPAMIASVITAWRKSMPDLHFTIEDTITQGSKVVLRLSFTGTYKAVLFAETVNPDKFNPPSKIRGTETLIFDVKNGKIDEIWEEFNESLMRFLMGSRWCAETRPMAPVQDLQPQKP